MVMLAMMLILNDDDTDDDKINLHYLYTLPFISFVLWVPSRQDGKKFQLDKQYCKQAYIGGLRMDLDSWRATIYYEEIASRHTCASIAEHFSRSKSRSSLSRRVPDHVQLLTKT